MGGRRQLGDLTGLAFAQLKPRSSRSARVEDRVRCRPEASGPRTRLLRRTRQDLAATRCRTGYLRRPRLDRIGQRVPGVVREYVLVDDIAVDPHGDRLGGGHGRHPADIERNVGVLGRCVEDRVFVSPGTHERQTGLPCHPDLQANRFEYSRRCAERSFARPEYRPVIAPGVWVVAPPVDREHVEGIVERRRFRAIVTLSWCAYVRCRGRVRDRSEIQTHQVPDCSGRSARSSTRGGDVRSDGGGRVRGLQRTLSGERLDQEQRRGERFGLGEGHPGRRSHSAPLGVDPRA